MFNVNYIRDKEDIKISVKDHNALSKIVNNHHHVFLRGDEHDLEVAMSQDHLNFDEIIVD